MQPTLNYNVGESPFRTIATLLKPLHYILKKPLLEAVVRHKNEAMEKSSMVFEKSAVEVNAGFQKQDDDAEIALALIGAVNENNFGVPLDVACENRNKCHRSNYLPNRHLLKKAQGR